MSSETNSFLKFLLSEDIYVIKEQGDDSTVSQGELVSESNPVATPVVSNNEENTKKESTSKRISEVLILFSNSDVDNMKPDEAAFLQKILGAVKIDINKVDLINVQKQAFDVSIYRKVIAFTAQHGLSVNDKYQLSSGNQIALCADDLKSIASSVDLKKKLWGELQKMFSAN